MNKTQSQTQILDPNLHQNDTSSARHLDANVLQRRASNPNSSIWVSASAGTGKTKVLTDRVLRLLLPREDGRNATPAHKILCLTFTKAAASEMALRISETLAKWAIMSDADLNATLKQLLGREANANETKIARTLFADIVDVPGGLKIMTIHAFCQSVLGRFPLEADINPHFTVLEDAQSKALMNDARAITFKHALKIPTSPVNQALKSIASTINEDQFLDLMRNISNESAQLEQLLHNNFGLDGLYTNICEYYGVKPNCDPANIIYEACNDRAFDKAGLQECCDVLAASAKPTDQGKAEKIASFLHANVAERLALYENYKEAFIKKDGDIYKDLATKDVRTKHPHVPEIMLTEAERILTLTDNIRALNSAALTRDILTLGHAVLEQYTALKAAAGALDFNDLILHTAKLLRGQSHNKTLAADPKKTGSWVHYKLDAGLDHILIDEAQDTNPEQWNIIEALSEEFYHGVSQNDQTRSIFTVGDEKQSIYSFQRASPAEFARMQNAFREKTLAAQQNWGLVPMNISFRTTKSVLAVVDATFQTQYARQGLGDLPVEHTAHRIGQAGHLELWPLCESDKTDSGDLWTPAISSENTQSGHKRIAAQIAQNIAQWLEKKIELQSYNRPIEPRDIMILVSTRSTLVQNIALELKNHNIPVSGLDRMVLTDEISIQDLLAAASFALQPLDDLTLACLLKSPIIGLSEEELFKLSANRSKGESLHASILSSKNEILKAYLAQLHRNASQMNPFEFFNHLLQTPCPADSSSARRAFMGRLGRDAMDPIDEFLNLARPKNAENAPNLHRFIHEITAQQHEIKRQFHNDANEVRIMTVHGSKGLQSPIVILPDTTKSAKSAPAKSEKRLLWPNQTGLKIPLWSPRQSDDCIGYANAKEAVDNRMAEEHRRLLYVAMTRAESHLYIGGALNKKQNPDKLDEQCWYSLIRAGIQSLPDHETCNNGSLRVTNPQTNNADKSKITKEQKAQPSELPAWLWQNAASKSQNIIIHRPSQIVDTATSPLSGRNSFRFLRGNLTHKLLQLLPDLPRENWQHSAQGFLENYGQALDQQTREATLNEILTILNHPEFKEIFGKHSTAEVAVTAHLENMGLVSGQIDRLYVSEEKILIIDYKTNRPPPANPAHIPDVYRRQMQTYADILRKIYPDRPIHAALLWTDGCILMPLDIH